MVFIPKVWAAIALIAGLCATLSIVPHVLQSIATFASQSSTHTDNFGYRQLQYIAPFANQLGALKEYWAKPRQPQQTQIQKSSTTIPTFLAELQKSQTRLNQTAEKLTTYYANVCSSQVDAAIGSVDELFYSAKLLKLVAEKTKERMNLLTTERNNVTSQLNQNAAELSNLKIILDQCQTSNVPIECTDCNALVHAAEKGKDSTCAVAMQQYEQQQQQACLERTDALDDTVALQQQACLERTDALDSTISLQQEQQQACLERTDALDNTVALQQEQQQKSQERNIDLDRQIVALSAAVAACDTGDKEAQQELCQERNEVLAQLCISKILLLHCPPHVILICLRYA
jgi:hypothetical protein